MYDIAMCTLCSFHVGAPLRHACCEQDRCSQVVSGWSHALPRHLVVREAAQHAVDMLSAFTAYVRELQFRRSKWVSLCCSPIWPCIYVLLCLATGWARAPSAQFDSLLLVMSILARL